MGRTKRMLGLAALGLVLAASAGCTSGEKPQEGAADFAAFVVPALPESAHPTMIDFGGKVHIVGYEVSPEGAARPSQSITVKLYWMRVGALDAGWGLFTHLEDDLGRQIRNFDREGAFHGKIAAQPTGLALLELGKIYSDEQTLELPKAAELTPRVSLVVGVWNQDMRLPVVSGTTNGHQAALIATFSTGVERQRPVALKGSKP
jgi:hypothetical protein